MYHGIKVRTTITLDDDVFEAAHALASASGKRLGEVVSHLARRGLEAAPAKKRGKSFPVFAVPPAAAMIPGNRAEEILSSERP
jgi:hypothetical protein